MERLPGGRCVAGERLKEGGEYFREADPGGNEKELKAEGDLEHLPAKAVASVKPDKQRARIVACGNKCVWRAILTSPLAGLMSLPSEE